MKFLYYTVQLANGNRTTTAMSAVYVSGERKATGVEVESRTVFPPKVEAIEIGEGSDIENAVIMSGIVRDNGGKSCPTCDYILKTLMEWGLSELDMMAGAQAGEMCFCFKAESSDGVVLVSTVPSAGVLPKFDAVRTKSYPSQSAKIY